MLRGRKPVGTIAVMGGLPSLLEPFAWSLVQMIQYNNDYLCAPWESIHYIKSHISFHAAARNNLVDQMRGDWMLMLDTDHEFEPDICARMLTIFQGNDLDILSALYLQKVPPFTPVIYQWNEDTLFAIADWGLKDENQDIPREKSARQKSLIPVGSTGAGCLMVHRRVFEKIATELKQGPFDIINPFGEDHSFFKRCKDLGFKAYCAPFIECYHLRLQGLTYMNDYDPTQVAIGPMIEMTA